MILVAGLAVAGLAGIAAAFYFSLRSGNGGNKRNSRVRSGTSGRTGVDRHAGGRRNRGTSDERPANGRRAANNSRAANPASRAANPASGNYRTEGRSGPNTVMDFGDAGDPGRAARPAPAGRRTRADSRPPEQVPTLAAPVFAAGNLDDTPGDAWPGDPGPGDARPSGARPGEAGPDGARPGHARPGSRSAARLARGADPAEQADAAKAPRSRRRVGFRKGAEIDEEMWPTEAFGGVTDDQFWDDLASDKPLTTTARSAQHDSGSPKRPLAAVPPPDARAGQKPGDARSQAEARGQGDGRGQGDDRSRGRRARNSGGYPDAQSAAADRTAVQLTQPVQAATQPVPSLGQPGSAAPARAASLKPGPVLAGPVQTAPAQTGPAQAGHLSPAGSPYQRTGPQTGPTRGWRHASGPGAGADEDPLTSAAFSLRSSGPVDGHSQQVPRRSREAGWDHYDIGREHYDVGRTQETQTFGAAQPREAEPRTAEPRTAEPRTAEPRTAEPRTAEPRGGGWAGSSGTAASPAYGPGTGPGQAYGATAPYPYPGQPYRDPAQETSATPTDTPPYGESSGGPAAPTDDPRRPNGARSHARHSGDGAANRAPRPAYQPGNGYQQGGSYQSGPYDPREDYRRLTSILGRRALARLLRWPAGDGQHPPCSGTFPVP